MKKFLLNKWTVIIASVVLAATIAVVVGLNFNKWFNSQDTAKSNDIFWNVDRAQYAYQSGAMTSTRPRDKDDSYYHVRFSNITQSGREVVRRVKDKAVVDKIDTYYCMMLDFDEKGIVTDAHPITDAGKDLIAKKMYVKEVSQDGVLVTANTSSSLSGIDVKYEFPKNVIMYDVSGTTGTIGTRLTTPLLEDDTIYVLGDAKTQKPQYVFLTNRSVPVVLYYNVKRMWNSAGGYSTREKNESGYFEFVLSANGTQATYKTKDTKIVSQMDSAAARCFSLILKEDNEIIGFTSASRAMPGGVFASWWRCTDVSVDDDGKTVMTAASSTATDSATLSKNCKIYDVTGVKETVVGEPTDLRVGDYVHCYKNKKGEVAIIYIVANRTVKSDIYWNVKRMYDSNKKETTRTPVGGKYVFDLGVGSKGKIETFYTTDKKIADSLDSLAGRCFGLKLNGNEIIGYYSARDVSGNSTAASWYTVTSVNGKTITSVKSDLTDTHDLDDNAIIINTTRECKHDTVEVGDVIHCLLNYRKMLKYVFIVGEAPKVEKRAYCSHCNQTVDWYAYNGGTPTGNKDGRHYILTADIKGGAQYSVGSSSNTTSNFTPLSNVLDLNGHTIAAENRAIAVQIGCGLTVLDSAGGGIITTQKQEVSAQGYGIWVREKATLNFMSGTIDMTGKTSRAFAGLSLAVESGATVNMSGGKICGATSIKDYRSNGSVYGGDGANVYLATKSVFNMSGGEISGGKSYSAVNNKSAAGGNINIMSNATFNMSGGKIIDGEVLGAGGNIANNGNLNITGGEIIGGYAKVNNSNNGGHGGNIYTSAKLNISGGVISDGIADKQGGNISANSTNAKVTMTAGQIKDGFGSSKYKNKGNVYIWNNDNATFNMSGGEIIAPKVIPSGKTGGGLFLEKGVVNLSGNPKITNGAILALATDKKVNVSALNDARITVYMDKTGIFADNAEEYISSFIPFDSNYEVIAENGSLKLVKGSEFVKTAFCPHCKQTVEWYKLSTPAPEYNPNGRHYVLTDNIISADQLSIGSDTVNKVNIIDLAGKTLLAKKRAIAIQKNSELTIVDTVGNGVISTETKNATMQGIGIWVRDNAKLTMLGGTVDMTGVSSVGYEGLCIAAETGSTVTMHDGVTLMGATSVEDYRNAANKEADKENGGDGANVYLANKAVFNMLGGEIKDGRSLSNIGGKSCSGANVNVMQGATFNMSGGKVSGGVSYGTGGNFAVGGTLNLSNSAIISGGVSQKTEKGGGHGGNIYLSGNLNMSGGNISDGIADKQGGNISLNSANSAVNMSGGKISGGLASDSYKNTGNIYIWNNDNATFNMSGGSVTSSAQIPEGKTGGAIYVSKGKLNLSKKIEIGGGSVNLYLTKGIKIGVSELDKSSKIGITCAESGVFAENAKDFKDNFISDNENYEIIIKNNVDLKYNLIGAHSHSLFENCYSEFVSDEIKKTDTDFLPLTQSIIDATSYTDASGATQTKTANALPPKGSWVLTENIAIKTALSGIFQGDYNLCLNGFEIECKDCRFISQNNSTSKSKMNINICDCKGTGRVYRTGNLTRTDQGCLIWTNGTSVFTKINIFGGIFDVSNLTSSYTNGGAAVYLASTAEPSTAGYNSFTVYGGTFKGATVSGAKASGILTALGKTVLNLYGGTFEGKDSYSDYGNVRIAAESVVANVGSGNFIKGNLSINSGKINLIGKSAVFDDNSCLYLYSDADTCIITLEKFKPTVAMKIDMLSPGIFIKSAKDNKDDFVSNRKEYEVTVSGNDLQLSNFS